MEVRPSNDNWNQVGYFITWRRAGWFWGPFGMITGNKITFAKQEKILTRYRNL
jgi:hypothetical protein